MFHPLPRSCWLLLCAVFAALSAARGDTGEFLITDHGAKGDNAFDNAPVINGLLAKFGAAGGTILIPEGDFRINSPIVITRNYVTIRGVNYGQRSNVDPSSGLFAPAGGSKLILGAGVLHGIEVPAGAGKIDGLTIKHLAIAGSDGGVYQTGIFVDRSNQWTRIHDVNCINLKKGVYLKQADDAQLDNCWLAECEAPLHLETGTDCIVADNSLGGQPGGVTAVFHAHQRLVFTGNVIFPDGYTGLWLSDCHNCNVSANTITSWYSGLVQIEGHMNSITDNNISGVLLGGSWPADPRGRDGSYGLIRISGNDNVCAGNTIMSWQPVGDTRVYVRSGERNVLRNLTIGANASTRRIFVNGTLTSATLITHCGVAGEIDLGGSASASVEYDP